MVAKAAAVIALTIMLAGEGQAYQRNFHWRQAKPFT